MNIRLTASTYLMVQRMRAQSAKIAQLHMALLATVIFLSGQVIPHVAIAQNAAGPGGCYTWIDAATGKSVPMIPEAAIYAGPYRGGGGNRTTELLKGVDDENHAHNPKTGQNFVRSTDGSWIDARTGEPVPVIPDASVYAGPYQGGGGYRTTELLKGVDDENHAHNPKTGQNFVRIPCPPPEQAQATPASCLFGFICLKPADPRTKPVSGGDAR